MAGVRVKASVVAAAVVLASLGAALVVRSSDAPDDPPAEVAGTTYVREDPDAKAPDGTTTTPDVTAAGTNVVAFPGAEGYGRAAVGGRGGRVVEVTNLDDSGPGSLRAALEASGPRTVIFRLGGTISLLSPIKVTNPYVTIAGQSAPGGGITIRAHPSNSDSAVQIHTHDVVVRHLRIRLGAADGVTGSADALRIAEGAHDVIIDHVSLSWGVDTCLQTGADARDITIQWSVIAECLHDANHEKGPHSMGYHMRSAESFRITFHHNLMAHNDFRNPQVSNGGYADLVNNVIYNYGRKAIHGSEKYMVDEPMRVNLVGNTLIPGASSEDSYAISFDQRLDPSPGMVLFLEDNRGPTRDADSDPETDIADPETRQWVVHEPAFAGPPVTTTRATEAYSEVLAAAGARVPAQDAVDARIIESVRTRTGSVIDDPAQVGGWPVPARGTPYADRDDDGMADDWEVAQALDPDDASDGASVSPSGYTWLEVFLDELARTATAAPGTARGMELACPDGVVPGHQFVDVVAGTVHEPAISCVVWWGIARGVSQLDYHPDRPVTREQMASFLARLVEQTGLALPAAPRDHFVDDDGSVHEERIDQLAALGIVHGVAEGRYAPAVVMSRGQMASVLVRAVEQVTTQVLEASTGTFADDDGSVHELNIEKAAAAGLTAGTRPRSFSPDLPVRRDQMATFVARTLDLLIESDEIAAP